MGLLPVAGREGRFRMYVDEVGNHHMQNLTSVTDPNHRYLSLTGVIMSLDHVETVVAPQLNSVKGRFFPTHHVDHPVILHRKDLFQKNSPFESLRDATIEAAFNEGLLRLLTDAEYTVITVVIDKAEHERRYTLARHPYHYCMGVLVERYVQWLEVAGGTGDVMFEARGRKEDAALREEFREVVKAGTSYVSAQRFDSRIVPKEPRLTPKKDNVAGLQFADLIAYPSYSAMRCLREGIEQKQNFSSKIIPILEGTKYRRSGTCIDGYGRKWLP